MSLAACDYYPDPPVCDYEPEYSRPADTSWLDRYRPQAPKPPRPAFSLVPRVLELQPQRITESPRAPKAWKPLLLSGGAGLSQPTTESDEEQRRDGAPVVIECAEALEHSCFLFSREADESAILDVEPHLRRVARALRRLTNHASRARRAKKLQDSLFE